MAMSDALSPTFSLMFSPMFSLMFSLTVTLALSSVGGGLLGMLFFGGLWWTVRRAFTSRRPALWVGGSLLLRMAAVAAGFVIVSAGDWRRLLACVLGFWAARWWVVRLTARLAVPPSGARCIAAQHGGSEVTAGPT